MCILPHSEPLLKKMNGRKSPAVVDVRSSVIFEVCYCSLCLSAEIFVDYVAIYFCVIYHVHLQSKLSHLRPIIEHCC